MHLAIPVSDHWIASYFADVIPCFSLDVAS